MKKKISARIEESSDMVISELAALCNTDKSTIFRVMIDLYIDKSTDNEGNILESVKHEIEEIMQCSRDGRDSPEL